VLAGIARKDRPVISSRPACRVSNFTSADTEIAEHAIIHAGEFNVGATNRQFGFDRLLYSFQDRKGPCDSEPCHRAPSRLARRRKR
jgi:hypothetical protein